MAEAVDKACGHLQILLLQSRLGAGLLQPNSPLCFFPHSIDLIPTHVNVSVHRGEHAGCAQAGEALSQFQSGDVTVSEG